jgi:two-component system copper resistance phosphate regulon response regulator CusR
MKRILVVEDEPRISSFIAKGLRSNGFTPTVVAEGLTGFDYAMSGEFDLVILDIGLPDMDGFTVLDRLRTRSPAWRVARTTTCPSRSGSMSFSRGSGSACALTTPQRSPS